MRVSVCLVTRNHAPSLGRAIQSVARFAAEVIVADTGSTDGTLQVAADANCRIVPTEWADDFSAVCNAALDAATGEWVLWLNPDEELEPASVPLVTLAAADSGVFAWHLSVREELRADRPGQGISTPQIRLFQRDAAVRYRGRLHPWFVQPLEQIAAARGMIVANTNAVIRRHAYLSKSTPDKIRWVVRLLEAELRDRPGQLGFTIELGRNLLWLNDPRGHDVLDAAADEVRNSGDAPAPPSPWVGSLIEYLLTVSSEQRRSSVGRDEARAWAARWFPRTPPVVWAVAGERFAAADYATAADHLRRLVEMGRTGRYDPAGFDPIIFGTSAVLNLGLCCLHLSQWDEAKACFAEARNDPQHRAAALQGYRLAETQQRPVSE
ncbi:glycosyltransferase [Limnoglobus roseus]|uniref:GT2 family glycosyltransferase n=1 Tax=Limnoglobus roseus TaxID=2598579 RepID=A0A5C1AGG5_9BACT|nr:glycosyltransferase [Limnoglobus roseus]QEL17920.1 GT2 family glycosyltransferase [Limnoglobus roseus]